MGGRGTPDMFSATTKDPDTELTDPSLNHHHPPPPPHNALFVAKETWRSEIKGYLDKSSLREEAKKQAVTIVLGQCSQIICNLINATCTYQGIISNNDLICILGLIRESLYTGSTTKKTAQSIQEAEESLMFVDF